MSIKSIGQMPSFISSLNNTISNCRNILRKEGITGMDSMRHLTLYTLARALNESECERLGIPLEFSWEHILELAKLDSRQECYDLLFNKNGNDLISHLDELFGTRNFNFKLKNADNHIAIVKQMAALNFQNLSGSVDILGTVYENHLGSGSSKSAMRDLGQFFTDRRVCDYMTKLCNPKTFPDNRCESVLDPTMGTGGFLTSFVKYLQEKGATVNWEKMQMDIAGYDIDEFVMSIGRINMYLSTGVIFERIAHRDTLHTDIGEPNERLKFKIILANMPFGVKALKFADCCKRVKELKCDGTKSEPLFLNLMMAALDEGGRCAVVVPDGALVNTSKQHNSTRKYLLDNFELKRVIKMKGQFFSNTGIQPSILFFENTGNPTKNVEFWEVEQGEDNRILEKVILSVPRPKFDDACSLDMRRYMQSEKPVANPAGFPMVKLGDILTDHPVKKPVATTHGDGGEFSLFSSSCDVFKHSEAEFSGRPYLLQGSRGTISKATHYCDTPFSASNNVFVLSSSNDDTTCLKFVYYYLCLTSVADKTATTSVIPMLTKTVFRDIEIPLPPLEIQQEIVATLDRIYQPGTTELSNTLKMANKAMDLVLANPVAATLKPIVEAQRLILKSAQMMADVKAQMVADVKAQMVAVVKASMSGNGCKKYTLSEIANDNPESLTKADKLETISYIDLGSVKEGNISEIQSLPYEERPSRAQRKVKNGDIIWGGVRPLLKSYAFIDSVTPNTIVSSGFVVVRNKDTTKVLSKYLYFLLTTDDCVNYLNNHSTGTSYPAFNASTLMSYEVSIPSIEVQTETLSYLNDLQTQLTSLESLQKQSERNAKFILDSYLNTAQ